MENFHMGIEQYRRDSLQEETLNEEEECKFNVSK